MIPNFDNYSLALIKDEKIVFSLDKSGLRPLVECFKKYKEGSFELHDKVTGLAAAKLISRSNIIKKLITKIISKPALDLLTIKVEYDAVVDNILMKDKSDVCPMEKKAIELSETDFYKTIDEIFK